jgi:hypothetical protein
MSFMGRKGVRIIAQRRGELFRLKVSTGERFDLGFLRAYHELFGWLLTNGE